MDLDFMFLTELIEACLEEEGFEVIDFSKTNTETTAAKGIYVKDKKGNEYTISFDKYKPMANPFAPDYPAIHHYKVIEEMK